MAHLHFLLLLRRHGPSCKQTEDSRKKKKSKRFTRKRARQAGKVSCSVNVCFKNDDRLKGYVMIFNQ